jgi:hypothetical protein
MLLEEIPPPGHVIACLSLIPSGARAAAKHQTICTGHTRFAQAEQIIYPYISMIFFHSWDKIDKALKFHS